MTSHSVHDELPERLARRLRRSRHWRGVAALRVALFAALAAALAGVWIYYAWPPSAPENNAHLEDFCSDRETVFDESPRLEATDAPSIVYWIDKDGLSNWEDLPEADQGYSSAELASAELIACGSAAHYAHVDDCSYYPPVGEVPVGAVDFAFEVYEAATHERVGEVVVENTMESGPFHGCPMYMEEGSSVLVGPQLDEVDAAIAGFAAAYGEG